MSTGGGDFAASGEDDTGDEVEGVYFDGEVQAGAISERSDVRGSLPSLGELDLTEDVYAILSDPGWLSLIAKIHISHTISCNF